MFVRYADYKIIIAKPPFWMLGKIWRKTSKQHSLYGREMVFRKCFSTQSQIKTSAFCFNGILSTKLSGILFLMTRIRKLWDMTLYNLTDTVQVIAKISKEPTVSIPLLSAKLHGILLHSNTFNTGLHPLRDAVRYISYICH